MTHVSHSLHNQAAEGFQGRQYWDIWIHKVPADIDYLRNFLHWRGDRSLRSRVNRDTPNGYSGTKRHCAWVPLDNSAAAGSANASAFGTGLWCEVFVFVHTSQVVQIPKTLLARLIWLVPFHRIVDSLRYGRKVTSHCGHEARRRIVQWVVRRSIACLSVCAIYVGRSPIEGALAVLNKSCDVVEQVVRHLTNCQSTRVLLLNGLELFRELPKDNIYPTSQESPLHQFINDHWDVVSNPRLSPTPRTRLPPAVPPPRRPGTPRRPARTPTCHQASGQPNPKLRDFPTEMSQL